MARRKLSKAEMAERYARILEKNKEYKKEKYVSYSVSIHKEKLESTKRGYSKMYEKTYGKPGGKLPDIWAKKIYAYIKLKRELEKSNLLQLVEKLAEEYKYILP